ncbi:MAG: HAMP domain-containing sensor histidine kinase [Verrucomicrobiota bacterium]|nr:HAMP domain-containing sensor histidine kinase [Verrucomicrobiota bacterium]
MPSTFTARLPALLLITLALAIYATLVAGFSWKLREEIRGQIIENTAAVLYPVTALRVRQVQEEMPVTDAELALNNLLTAVMDTADMDGVVAMRVFKADGTLFESIPSSYREGLPTASLLTAMRLLKPQTSYHSAAPSEVFFTKNEAPPVQGKGNYLEVALPLHDADFVLLGFAQLLIDGEATARNLAALDGKLLLQAGQAFLGGSALLGAAVWWAFRRLHRANALLAERSQRLAEANHELLLSAKTSAIGAISAHLIHGLKNPLAGLCDYMAARDGGSAGDSDERVLAAEATQRMQTLIQDVVAVLRGESAGDTYDFTLKELGELSLAKVHKLAAAHKVQLVLETIPDGNIDSRRGNLVLLILANLLQNAIEASEPEGSVRLILEIRGTMIEFIVLDHGQGLPEAIRENPFKVNPSGKPGGSGLGLAISSQLARHIGGEITLMETGASGTSILLKVPQVL